MEPTRPPSYPLRRGTPVTVYCSGAAIVISLPSRSLRSGTHPILSGMGRSHSPLLVEAKHKLDGGDGKKRRLCDVKLVTERIDYKYSMRTTC